MALTEDTVQYDSLVLDKLPVRFTRLEENLGTTFLSALELTARRDQTLDAMVYEMSSYVLGEKLVDKTVSKDVEWQVYVPSSWWQHFKRDVLTKFWTTRWFVRKWPVLESEHSYYKKLTANFQQYATFPAADIRMPEDYHKGVIVAYERINLS